MPRVLSSHAFIYRLKLQEKISCVLFLYPKITIHFKFMLKNLFQKAVVQNLLYKHLQNTGHPKVIAMFSFSVKH